MSLIQELKETTGLNSQQIADFAGISRSLLSMAKSGSRDIPHAAHMKLTALCQVAIESRSIPEKTAKQLLDQAKSAAKQSKKLGLH